MHTHMDAPDYGTIKKEEDDKLEYKFAPRTVESVNESFEVDRIFDSLFERKFSQTEHVSEDKIAADCGFIVGKYMQSEMSRVPKGRLDIAGEMRAFTAFQGFLERQLIKRGGNIVNFFRNQEFLAAVNAEAPFAHAERMNEKLKGAESVNAFVGRISKNENVLFIGSELNLDARHAIDLVVGVTDSPKDDSPQIDEVVLVQVKSSIPGGQEISKIILKHKEYAAAIKEFEGLGVGTKEHDFQIGKLSPEQHAQKDSELCAFYEKIGMINPELKPTWESLVENAKVYECDPVLLYIRLRSINETRLHFTAKLFKKNALYLAKEKAEEIKVPQEEMAKYNRLTRGDSHISSAKRIRSIVMGDGQVVSDTVLA